MRRSDREVTDFQELIAIMQRCDVCRIALNNDGYPYILPLNFGMHVQGETVELIFHGAATGTKLDLMAADSRASFEMDCAHQLVMDQDDHSCTMEYESVIGRGRMVILSEEEKLGALKQLMAHYHQEDFPFDQGVVPRTAVFKLVVEQMTGKRRKTKK